MEHLESKQIVHRDLAARNVLGMCCDVVVLADNSSSLLRLLVCRCMRNNDF